MAITGARGEGMLAAHGREYAILFTNRALAQVEKAIGRPILQLLRDVQNNDLTIDATAQLLAIGMEHGRRDAHGAGAAYTLDDAWALMDAVGFTTAATVVLGAVAAVLVYTEPNAQADDKNAGPPA